jgi:hypothetical protein
MGNELEQRLIAYGAAYYSTIAAGRTPAPLDPFLADLIARAIRLRAGIPQPADKAEEVAPADVDAGAARPTNGVTVHSGNKKNSSLKKGTYDLGADAEEIRTRLNLIGGRGPKVGGDGVVALVQLMRSPPDRRWDRLDLGHALGLNMNRAHTSLKNALNRLVKFGWIEKVGGSHYQITEKGQ